MTDDLWAKRETRARTRKKNDSIIRYALPYRELDPFRESRARVWRADILSSAFSIPSLFILMILMSRVARDIKTSHDGVLSRNSRRDQDEIFLN